MEKNKIEQGLVEVLTVVLGRKISPEDLHSSKLIWDSLKHIEIIFAVEERFNVQFSEKEIPQMGTCASLFEHLKQKYAP